VSQRQQVVGRSNELAEMASILTTASAGEPRVALVRGEAGSGKTRLLDEVLARLPDGTLVGRGAGVGFLGGRMPYAPLVAALRSLLSRLPRDRVPEVLGPDPSDLALLLPELGARPDAVSDQTRLIASVCAMLDRAAEVAPTVIVLDDMHWADVATLEMLAYACAGLDQQRLAIVVAYRQDEVGDALAEWLQDRRRAPLATEITVGPLSLAETTQQLTNLLGGDPRSVLGPALAARIHSRTGGNPYAAEALMRAALAGDEDTLPASLREVLVRRTRACSPPTAELLRIVATAGERVAPAVLSAVAANTGLTADLDAAVDEAVRGHLLVADAEGGLTMRHALLAEALYADLLPGERRALHGLLADALEQADARPAAVAEHADRAHQAGRALVWSMRAASAAEHVYAYDDSHTQYERVRRLWPTVPDAAELVGEDAVDVFAKAASIAAICDQDVTAVEIIERVRSWLQADPDEDPVRLGLLEAKYARFLLDAGRIDAALVAARRAVDLVPADPPTTARAVVVSGLVHVLDWAGGSSDWEPLAHEAVAVARATGEPAALSRALIIRSTVLPDAHSAVPDAREAVRLALEDGTPELVGQAYSNLVDCLQCDGEEIAGVAAAKEGVDAVSQRGLGIRYGSWLRTQAAELCLAYGAWDQAEDLLQAALRDTRHVVGTNRDYALVNHARLRGLRGDVDGLAADLADTGRLPAVVQQLRCEAEVDSMLWQGQAETALAALTHHVRQATPRLLTMAASLAWMGARALADLKESRLPRARGDEEAEEHGTRQEAGLVADLIDAACGPAALPGTRPAEMRLLCVAEQARGGPVEARVAPWRAAAAALDTAARPYLAAYARWRLAAALVATRDRAGASDELRQAHETARGLGAAPLVAQVEALARRARIELRRPVAVAAAVDPDDRIGTLTTREREILAHLAAGRTNGEIARALVISTKTASVHVSNILRKLDVASRYEAAELAER
jgi:DNA-binding CsgD family transcriptional regulator